MKTNKSSKFSLNHKLLFITLSLNLLVGCGFQPIYKTNVKNGTNYENELAAIQIKGVQKRIHQKLKNNLEDTLNPNNIKVRKKYILSIKIQKSISATLINPTGSSGRNKVTLTATYDLKTIDSKEIIASGNAIAKDDYNIASKKFANYITQEEMELNITKLIALNIRDLLINDLFSKKD
jgi:LPS-assembly lipoprotein